MQFVCCEDITLWRLTKWVEILYEGASLFLSIRNFTFIVENNFTFIVENMLCETAVHENLPVASTAVSIESLITETIRLFDQGNKLTSD